MGRLKPCNPCIFHRGRARSLFTCRCSVSPPLYSWVFVEKNWLERTGWARVDVWKCREMRRERARNENCGLMISEGRQQEKMEERSCHCVILFLLFCLPALIYMFLSWSFHWFRNLSSCNFNENLIEGTRYILWYINWKLITYKELKRRERKTPFYIHIIAVLLTINYIWICLYVPVANSKVCSDQKFVLICFLVVLLTVANLWR